MDFSELPAGLHEIMTEAEGRIGAQRAVIALQGSIYKFHSLRVINGMLNSETVAGARVVTMKIGIERLVELIRATLRTRFPAEYAEPVTLGDWATDDVTVIEGGTIEDEVEVVQEPTVRRKSTRRVK